MKKLFTSLKLLLVVSLSMVIMGCPNPDPEPEPSTISASPTSISVDAGTSKQNITVTSNTGWSAYTNQTWVSLGTKSGYGNNSIPITVNENKSTDRRSAEITLTTEDAKAKCTISISQEGAFSPALSVNPNNISVGNSSCTATANITSNTDWTLSSSESWCAADITSGNGDKKITFAIAENAATAEREAKVKIKTVGDKSKEATITVKQSGAAEYISISPDRLSVSSSKSSGIVELTSNTDWITFNEDSTWISIDTTYGNGNKKLTVTIAKNNNRTSRDGVVIFKTKGGTAEAKLIVEQEASDAFLYAEPEYITVDPNEGSAYIELNANVEWTAQCADSWIKIVPSSGRTGGSINFKIAQNTAKIQRSTTVEFISKDGKLKSVVNVTQTKGNGGATLSVTPSNITIGHLQYTAYISISSSSSWTVSSSASWAKVSTSSGSGNKNITVSISANTSRSDRTATVTIRTKDGSSQRKVQIKQLGYSNDHDIEDMIPTYIIDKLDDYVPIYSGTNPPAVTGSYFIDPNVTVYCEDPEGYSPGYIINSYYFRFDNQNSSDNTISFKEKSASGNDTSSGNGYISGYGSNFTIFLNTEGISSNVYNKTATVISGTKTSTGIKNLYYAFVMLEVGPDPYDYIMEEGYFRVFKDKDGLSVNSSWNGNTNYVTTETKPSEVREMLNKASMFGVMR